MSLHYLTVQDILWINFQLTKKSQPFRYADLEEATFYQYAYGESASLIPQATKFLTGFMKKAPLADGNGPTAVVGCLAFLKINGVDLEVGDLATWFRSIANGTDDAQAAIEQVAHEDHHGHHGIIPDVRAAMQDVLTKHEAALQALVGAAA